MYGCIVEKIFKGFSLNYIHETRYNLQNLIIYVCLLVYQFELDSLLKMLTLIEIHTTIHIVIQCLPFNH